MALTVVQMTLIEIFKARVKEAEEAAVLSAGNKHWKEYFTIVYQERKEVLAILIDRAAKLSPYEERVD